jgi:hypothetical protein
MQRQAAKMRRKEREEDASIQRLNMQLQAMIREGKEALGTTVVVDDMDMDTGIFFSFLPAHLSSLSLHISRCRSIPHPRGWQTSLRVGSNRRMSDPFSKPGHHGGFAVDRSWVVVPESSDAIMGGELASPSLRTRRAFQASSTRRKSAVMPRLAKRLHQSSPGPRPSSDQPGRLDIGRGWVSNRMSLGWTCPSQRMDWLRTNSWIREVLLGWRTCRSPVLLLHRTLGMHHSSIDR